MLISPEVAAKVIVPEYPKVGAVVEWKRYPLSDPDAALCRGKVERRYFKELYVRADDDQTLWRFHRDPTTPTLPRWVITITDPHRRLVPLRFL